MFRIPFQTSRVIFALFMRELTTAYGRSYLGFLWAMIEPIGGIVVLAYGFSLLLRNPPLGESFILFYATGYLPFLLYSSLASKVSNAIRQNRALLFYPAVTFIDVIAARTILTIITEMIVMIAVLGTILLLADTASQIRPSAVAIAFVLAAGLGLGIGMLNSVLFERWPAWRSIWQIINRPLVFISGVMFLPDSLPEPARDMLAWNPLMHVIGEFRHGFYPGYEANYVSLVYAASSALLLVTLGLVALRRADRFIMNN